MSKEPTRKLVVDIPASVMEGLEAIKTRHGDGATIKGLVLDAIAASYGLRPNGVPVAATVRAVPKPGKK